jgi:RNA polymerase sigma-70 factor (ECF subfamily)
MRDPLSVDGHVGEVAGPHQDADARQGDLANLVAAHDRDMTKVCYFILGDRDLARDATQESWLRYWAHPPELRQPGKIRSWLLTVAANEARKILRRRRIAVRLEPLSAATATLSSVDPGDRAAEIDVHSVLGTLKPDDRLLLAMRYVVGLNATELGDMLRITPEAVRSRLHRMLMSIREEVDR